MLVLMCHAGENRYAIDSAHVVEVVPYVHCDSIANAPNWLAGMFAYRGRATALVDLTLLTTGEPCPRRWNSRIVIVRCEAEDRHRLFGLLAERVAAAVIDEPATDRPALDSGGLAAGGPVLLDEQGMFRLLDPTRLPGNCGDAIQAILPERSP